MLEKYSVFHLCLCLPLGENYRKLTGFLFALVILMSWLIIPHKSHTSTEVNKDQNPATKGVTEIRERRPRSWCTEEILQNVYSWRHYDITLPSLMSPCICGCFCGSCEGCWSYKVAWTFRYCCYAYHFLKLPCFVQDRITLSSLLS